MILEKDSTHFLFVYGTLMQGFSNPFAKKLQQNAIWRGKASFTGQLFDLGTYPGAVYDQNASTTVQGEVWQLNDFQKTIKALDYYEGIHEKEPEYVRQQIPVLLESGEKIDCWAYIYCLPTYLFELIPSGDHRQRLVATKQHLRGLNVRNAVIALF